MTDPYTYGSQHGDPLPIPEDSYLAWWLAADQAQQDAQRLQDMQQQQDNGNDTAW